MKKRPRLCREKAPYVATPELLAKLTKVDVDTGCHLWTGKPNHNGYGRIGINYKDHLVHRLAYELHNGPIPDGLFVCHKCDVRLCVNPDHLFLGTLQDNHADMCKKKRNPMGANQRLAKLSDDAVRDIRTSTSSPSELAKKYGVIRRSITMVLAKQTWKHVV